MVSKYRKFLRFLGILVVITIIQVGIFAMLNYPFIRNYNDSEIEDRKTRIKEFSLSHQNTKSSLFVDPDISSNYFALSSINFTFATELSSDLIDPKDNDNLPNDRKQFFLNYFVEKQNENGSFSDNIGLGDMELTYQVINIIDKLDTNFIYSYSNRIEKIYRFLNETLMEYGWGFKSKESSQEADVVSTFYGIYLAKRFGFSEIYQNENLTKFIESIFTGVAYQYSPTIPLINPETTFYGINSYIALNNEFFPLESYSIYSYISFLFNTTEGSYSQFPGENGDIKSTFYALGCIESLEFDYHDEDKSFDYILQCSRSNGGFVSNPYISNVSSSNFESGWAAINSYNLLNNDHDQEFSKYLNNYYNWLSEHQAKNGLFGNITLASNYYGILTTDLVVPEQFTDCFNVTNYELFIQECYNLDGGYGSQKNELSTIYDTYLAINMYRLLNKHLDIPIPNSMSTITFLREQQNEDGGFRLGNSSIQLNYLFGPYSILLNGVLEENTSIIQNSYWASECLDYFNAIDEIDVESLIEWTLACQNADGGYSLKVGFISEMISTYYGLKLLNIFEIDPLSSLGVIKFIQETQNSNGYFELNPLLSEYIDMSPSFLVSYYAAMSLYENNYQPDNFLQFKQWYDSCLDTATGGVGDSDFFGANLRNSPYGILLIEEMKFDRSINPNPINMFLIYMVIIEAAIIALFIIFKLLTNIFISITQTFNLRLFKHSKLNESYLKQHPAVRCENLSIYVGRKLIVDSISIEIQHGEVLGILGESGAGKSTFVKALLGMRKYKGTNEIYGMDARKNSKVFRPIYGYVPQDLSKIYHNITVLQNLIYFGQQYDLTVEEISLRAEKILKTLKIEDKKDSLVRNLSGGQKRRVSIALGLIHNPIVCILDEPTSGLDPVVRENLWLALTDVNEKFNTTLIVITHYPEESRFCDKVAIFGRKRGMIDYGEPDLLLSQLPGEGRVITLGFKTFQDNAASKLEKIDGIEKVLENKSGIDFSLYTDLNLETILKKIELEYSKELIEKFEPTEARMEQYFRFKSMVVPIE